VSSSDAYGAETRLLNAELPDPRFADNRYLQWLYDSNPLGPGFTEHFTEDGELLAHYALVPQRYRNGERVASFAFSLNAVTAGVAHRRGLFSTLGERLWARAGDAGVEAIIGVTNDKSVTPVSRLGWRLLGRLPVVVAPRVPGAHRAFDSVACTPAFLGSPDANRWLTGWDPVPAGGWTNCWTPESLRWRLGWVNCGPYALHRSAELAAVSTVTKVRGVRVAVVCKLAVLPGAGPHVEGGATTTLVGRGAVSAACAFHRAPVAVYAGFNRWVSVPGRALPESARPVPLNLMVKVPGGDLDQGAFTLDTFEFLDMDAY